MMGLHAGVGMQANVYLGTDDSWPLMFSAYYLQSGPKLPSVTQSVAILGTYNDMTGER